MRPEVGGWSENTIAGELRRSPLCYSCRRIVVGKGKFYISDTVPVPGTDLPRALRSPGSLFVMSKAEIMIISSGEGRVNGHQNIAGGSPNGFPPPPRQVPLDKMSFKTFFWLGFGTLALCGGLFGFLALIAMALQDWTEAGGFIALLLLPVFFISIGGVATSLATWYLSKRRKLYREGTATRGWIVSSKIDILWGIWVKKLIYEYNSPLGRLSGEWSSVRDPTPGTCLWIIYDPNHPDQSVPWFD